MFLCESESRGEEGGVDWQSSSNFFVIPLGDGGVDWPSSGSNFFRIPLGEDGGVLPGVVASSNSSYFLPVGVVSRGVVADAFS